MGGLTTALYTLGGVLALKTAGQAFRIQLDKSISSRLSELSHLRLESAKLAQRGESAPVQVAKEGS